MKSELEVGSIYNYMVMPILTFKTIHQDTLLELNTSDIRIHISKKTGELFDCNKLMYEGYIDKWMLVATKKPTNEDILLYTAKCKDEDIRERLKKLLKDRL